MKLKICPFTKNEIKNHHFSPYLVRESKNRNILFDDLKILVLKETFGDICEKDRFTDFYVVREYSLPDFKKQFEMSYKDTLFLIKFYKLEKRDISKSKKTPRSKQKLKNTIGVDNISQLEITKQKKRETFIKNYGVDNIWKTKEYYKWLDSYMLENFGSKRIGCAIWSTEQRSAQTKQNWENLSESEKNQIAAKFSIINQKRWDKLSKEERKMATIHLRTWYQSLTIEEKEIKILQWIKNLQTGCQSKLETKISEALVKLKLKFESQFGIARNKFDFLIKNFNMILEIQGDFWHANPKKYQESDILNFPGGEVVASEIWEKDRLKKELANSKGFGMIYLWENEINKSKNLPELILKKISDEIKRN